MFQWMDSEATVRLLDDIRRANAGDFEIASVADAPVLDDYKAVLGRAYALTGIVCGHPRLTDGKEIITSQLFYLNEELAICRTMNRWYRLGMRNQGRGH
ncbi:DUF6634 family protein [Rhizobium leguminosarum]|uniref:DUF6634 family protein n=1 Tax=Rhizobium leguminosarum TaxID=384 RepID=UPI0021BC226F|nr:DUF6634 family protein [Rhizobium leguminosarum]